MNKGAFCLSLFLCQKSSLSRQGPTKKKKEQTLTVSDGRLLRLRHPRRGVPLEGPPRGPEGVPGAEVGRGVDGVHAAVRGHCGIEGWKCGYNVGVVLLCVFVQCFCGMGHA